ncbi:hypothetical protein GCM10023340_40920 [Nocardioides marinquilinus]|uniref:DUF732 domain-containing protein n=1 Tax=Nocardioides marinquilinus TaxID=1210400 RepID=A0ABP9Q809_9ACTN
MADAHLDRRVWAAVPLVLVALVVVLVLVLGGGADDGGGGGGGGAAPGDAAPDASGSPSPTATTTTSTAPTSPDQFCIAFRAFAEASNNLVATPTDPAAQDTLREAGRTLLDLPTPLGLSAGGEVSLEQLVAGSLAGIGEDVELDPGVEPDQKALDSYLATTCPA